jgi:hypothetical protein
MLTAMTVVGAVVLPLASVGILLALAAWRDGREAASVARQIRLTDAIGRELGAIVAPTVTRGWTGPWQVRIAVPLAQAATVARIVAIAHASLEVMGGRYELVLTPQIRPVRPVAVPMNARPRLRAA